jgi:hypothetical protein
MTASLGESPPEVADDLPRGGAPLFGTVPDVPFEHTPEHLVLSSEAHSRLSGNIVLGNLNGPFADEQLGRGVLVVRETSLPGQVHIHADLSTSFGPVVHLDADVRESWLDRAGFDREGVPAPARVVGELFRLAEIPRQSTVVIRVEAD